MTTLTDKDPKELLERTHYKKALDALQAAHDACFKAPDRDVLGMSHGPFSGVNVALGIVDDLEHRLAGAIIENARLRALLVKARDSMLGLHGYIATTMFEIKPGAPPIIKDGVWDRLHQQFYDVTAEIDAALGEAE